MPKTNRIESERERGRTHRAIIIYVDFAFDHKAETQNDTKLNAAATAAAAVDDDSRK